jgi:hypothetical protein
MNTQLSRFTLMMGLMLWASLALASDDEAAKSAFWVDTTGVATLEDAINRSELGAFRSFDRVLAEGFIPHPIWVALTLPAGDPDAEHWVIRIRPPWHDQIELFDPNAASLPIKTVGSQVDSPIAGYESLTLDFAIPQQAEERTLFLKIQTAHSLLLHLDVLDLSTARKLDQERTLFFGFYFAFLAAVLFWSLITWFGDRERVLGAFCLQLMLSIAYAAFMFGVARVLFSDALSAMQVDALTNLLIIAYPISVIWFYRELFADYGLRLWPRRVLDLFVAIRSEERRVGKEC